MSGSLGYAKYGHYYLLAISDGNYILSKSEVCAQILALVSFGSRSISILWVDLIKKKYVLQNTVDVYSVK